MPLSTASEQVICTVTGDLSRQSDRLAPKCARATLPGIAYTEHTLSGACQGCDNKRTRIRMNRVTGQWGTRGHGNENPKGRCDVAVNRQPHVRVQCLHTSRTSSSSACKLTLTMPRTEVALQQEGLIVKHPFRVCSFNVLADGLAQSGDFVKVSISCLMWEHRLPLILEEVRAADADIICLQELNHFDVLAAALVPEGYSCFFRAKSPSPCIKFGFPPDGIALFFRHKRFSCLLEPSGHCFASMDGQPAAQGYVTALLHDKEADRQLLVAATHLKAKAGADNEQTRVHQANQLLQELHNLQDRHKPVQPPPQQPAAAAQGTSASTNNSSSSSNNNRSFQRKAWPPAVLLCGDLNTTPDSDTVQVINNHQLLLHSIWDVPWAQARSSSSSTNGNSNGSADVAISIANSNCNDSQHGSEAPALWAPASNGTSSHSNGNGTSSTVYSSATSEQQHQPCSSSMDGFTLGRYAEHRREFTTWKFRSTGAAKRTIDYIWYSRQQLAPTSRWRMLSEAEIGPEGLPSRHYPSDHMCVACQFGWLE